ncbi:DUF2268 domain-containing protein [Nocardia sp. NBC_00881]|uniref:DUF2268 domain-containing putative Zn-dependent protease n=1 Tax=Nocardia sp. NBC_00881 TaxID=2975995 RepID=UPI003868AF2B|nr:DUF2268 domain-containing protein [Nocardia sp. NBC_00881]
MHELHHNLRYSPGGVVWNPTTVTVGEQVVSEGLAAAFARQLYGEGLGYTTGIPASQHRRRSSAGGQSVAREKRWAKSILDQPIASCRRNGAAIGSVKSQWLTGSHDRMWPCEYLPDCCRLPSPGRWSRRPVMASRPPLPRATPIFSYPG